MSPEAFIKAHKRRPIGGGGEMVDYRTAELRRLLPHRPPFLLLDRVENVDLDAQTCVGHRTVPTDDPVFAGHFPDEPVYPGVLQLEIMGQLGLCAISFTTRSSLRVPEDLTPAAVRALKIHHALFLRPVRPNAELSVHASVIENNGVTAICGGQLLQGGEVTALAVSEVYLAD